MQKNLDNNTKIRPEIEEALISWNDKDIAFIKNDILDGKSVWMIFAANGTMLASVDSRDYAFMVAKENNLQPQSVN